MISTRQRDETPLSCEQVRDLFSAMLDGTGRSDLGKRADEHMEDCDGCRTEWDEYRVGLGAVGTLPRHPVPRSFAADVMAALPKAESTTAPPEPVPTRDWRGSLRWVALVLLALLLTVLYVEHRIDTGARDELALRSEQSRELEAIRAEVRTAFDDTMRGLAQEREELRERQRILDRSLTDFVQRLETLRTLEDERHTKLAARLEELNEGLRSEMDLLSVRTEKNLASIRDEQERITQDFAQLRRLDVDGGGPALADAPAEEEALVAENATYTMRPQSSLRKVALEESLEYDFDPQFRTDEDYWRAFDAFEKSSGRTRDTIYSAIVGHFRRTSPGAVAFVEQRIAKRYARRHGDGGTLASVTSPELSKDEIDLRAAKIQYFEEYYRDYHRYEPEDEGRSL